MVGSVPCAFIPIFSKFLNVCVCGESGNKEIEKRGERIKVGRAWPEIGA